MESIVNKAVVMDDIIVIDDVCNGEKKEKSTVDKGISDHELRGALELSIRQCIKSIGHPKKVLLIPPDFTRMHSGAGRITGMYYEMLKDTCHIDIMPALGTHEPMTPAEINEFFGMGIPHDAFIVHNWRKAVVKIGQVPADYVAQVSEGLVSDPVDVEVNRRIVDGTYDLIISIGQVVPHEVVGMANYSKNIFVGCGGSSMINQSHMLGAFYGIERIMGRDHTPVRKVFDYAQSIPQRSAADVCMTVTTQTNGEVWLSTACLQAPAGGYSRKRWKLSQRKNIIFVDKPLKKVTYTSTKKEFKSTWLGNKAVYRTGWR